MLPVTAYFYVLYICKLCRVYQFYTYITYVCSPCFQKYQANMKVIKGCFSSEKTAFMKTMRGLANTRQEKYS